MKSFLPFHPVVLDMNDLSSTVDSIGLGKSASIFCAMAVLPNHYDRLVCFRLDTRYIVDATTSGNLARFINHSCEPNCCCRVIASEDGSHHIVIFASREINIGEEITYDYKFNVEEESLKVKCRCGAPACLGRMN